MEEPRTSPLLSQIGEREAIRRLAARLGTRADVRIGIGDDCAVTEAAGSPFDWLLTSDPVIEGVHFLSDAPPGGIGHKAAGRVLSDIAACGGEPLWLLFNVVAPPDCPVRILEAAYDGAARLCSRHGAAIVGGDLARGERLEWHAFGVGRVPRGRAVLRSGARPGDTIYVTGRLGGSGFRGRHLDFEPRVREGRWLGDGGWATAMLDVSDGLAADLRRLLECSGVGARIRLPDIPVSDDARALAGNEEDARRHALCDGEDFELLFTVRPDRRADFERNWRANFELDCTAIGEMTEKKERLLAIRADGGAIPCEETGYEHFRHRTAHDRR